LNEKNEKITLTLKPCRFLSSAKLLNPSDPPNIIANEKKKQPLFQKKKKMLLP
jgi:hypothetical protein